MAKPELSGVKACKAYCDIYQYCKKNTEQHADTNNDPAADITSLATYEVIEVQIDEMQKLYTDDLKGLTEDQVHQFRVYCDDPDGLLNSTAKIAADKRRSQHAMHLSIYQLRQMQAHEAQKDADHALSLAVTSRVEAYGGNGPATDTERVGLFGKRTVSYCCHGEYSEFRDAEAMMQRLGVPSNTICQPEPQEPDSVFYEGL